MITQQQQQLNQQPLLDWYPATALKSEHFSPDLLEQLRNLGAFYLGEDVSRIIMRVASRPPPAPGYFPHHTEVGGHKYIYAPSEWWTSGFFPGCIWQLYRRSLQQPQAFSSSEILAAALQWQSGLEKEQHNRTTHDLGFMIMPSFYSDWSLRGTPESRKIIINAAHALSSRWCEQTQCLRSWDSCVTKRFNYTDADKQTDFLVIIDNMMNLDLLYVGAQLSGDAELARRATLHARTTLRYHVREDASTYHLVDYNPASGKVKGQYTVQGFADSSCWSRGQAWGLYGFATAYRYTQDTEFLEASVRLAEYFCRRVVEGTSGKNAGAVLWDFDAPRPPNLLDTSAAMVACSGIILLCQLSKGVEMATRVRKLLPTVVMMMNFTARNAKAPQDDGGDTILKHATVNSNRDAFQPVADVGLVYADYYFLEAGNRLMEMLA
ncbi:glycoside hydrolase family 88 protein [Niveomyces insectorum RCEF 264]|uniref:Glycoside hydrolase family 88 protein n=1 Tax=Niveomyces insectorum RCEF 264 TaxID=1081102 RepID=A0A167RTC9_9HYPO|nr:glycoside hydrolase family 88 protein [Niveomyces insectorum RCEF 264]